MSATSRSAPLIAAASVLLMATRVVTAEPPAAPASAVGAVNDWVAGPARRWGMTYVRLALADLAAADPDVRDRARDRLMCLSRSGLDLLLAVVRDAGPLRPAQAGALRDIVGHVFLATEPEMAEHDDGLPHPLQQYRMGISDPPVPTNETPRLGVPVVQRWPGFPAYRLLHDGDLIVSVRIDPHDANDLPHDEPTPTTDEYRKAVGQAVKSTVGSSPVELVVIRDGRQLRISIQFVPRPATLRDNENGGGTDTDAFLLARQQRADAYWAGTFGPLVDPGPANAADDGK